MTEDFTPDESDAYISNSGPLGSRTTASFDGKVLGEFNSERRALAAIRLEMMRTKFYPNVWQISDHENVHGPLTV